MLKVYLKVALAVLLFCLIQAVGSAVLYMLMPDAFLNGGNTNVQMLAWALMLTGLCSCLVLVAMKMIRRNKVRRNWYVLLPIIPRRMRPIVSWNGLKNK